MPHRVACVDVGSTFTKAVLVDLDAGAVVAAAEHPTTVATDVMDGVDDCLRALDAVETSPVLCSSAGGGLRIAVVGNEELVTAEAGRRVALSSGGKVVAVVAGAEPAWTLADLAEPDVVLLVGGTDGGNTAALLAAASRIVGVGWAGPVVVAGNTDARAEVGSVLADLQHVVTDNVVPRIGVLHPDGARAAIREVFLKHVIGGKGLSTRPEFQRLVRGATPDVVLTGVEVLARRPEVGGRVVVVDVGGATTDVHSVVPLDPEDGALARDVVAPTTLTRTVEGDLGMRWSAPSTVEAAELSHLVEAAARRRAEPGFVPGTDTDLDDDEALARAACGLALRRHAGRSRVVVSPEGRVVERTGVDLRETALLVASGGVFRHGRAGVADRVLAGASGLDGPVTGGWQLPERPRVVVDDVSVLAAVGLLAEFHPDAARKLAARLLR